MSVYVKNTYRIKRSAAYQESMKTLIDSNVFEAYKDMLMISAVIGYNANKYEPIKQAATDGILMQFLSERDYDIIDLIAYGHTKAQSIVTSDEKYEIFESYANGGYPILLANLNYDGTSEIDTNTSRNMLIKYYMKLLSSGFYSDDVEDDDLLI